MGASPWTTSSMDKFEYVAEHRDMYEGFLEGLAATHYTPWDLTEFAILSAHTPFDTAKRAWEMTRGVSDVGAALVEARIGLVQARARAVYEIRNLEIEQLPSYWARDAAHVKGMPGLGWSKYSFAASLLDPLYSDAICLDTHMFAMYNEGARAPRSFFASEKQYRELEERVLRDADSAGVTPFLWQWATWDRQRGKVETHEFLY